MSRTAVHTCPFCGFVVRTNEQHGVLGELAADGSVSVTCAINALCQPPSLMGTVSAIVTTMQPEAA